MITKKEDLINTYIENEPETTKTYIELCNKFGIHFEWNGDSSGEINEQNAKYVEIDRGAYYFTNLPGDIKKLTLSDLKPRTKVTYEQLDESNFNVWDLKPLLDGGELYSKTSSGEYKQYSKSSPTYMISHFMEYGVYRKVERPVDWFDDLTDFVKQQSSDDWELEVTNNGDVMRMTAEMTRDQWCDFARILLEQEGE